MKVNYILIIAEKAYECSYLSEMRAYFSWGITNDRRVICNGYTDTMSYSKEWCHEELILDFIRNRIAKIVPNVKIYRVEQI